ncbi:MULTISPECIES: cache domain-containing protein [Pseudomonas syringae group]|uniref:Methyl-accepting chemotaxis protein n=1 Tax=Pseudomonas syringae pv. tomato TaxID=323 RepID=A0AAV1BL25_PSEUB|nr:Methyl-accepting chemotaxis protein PctC [Pseudomonas syringae pv. tomato]KUR50217.1 Methyl-accepting chemotaxis protein PctC [Pseudomonas syringae pv. tomato]RMQ73908.1 Methyl-accepting chemotaxis protein [Pseudomonas syringae pv. tomato]CAI8884068.1 Methyl-accepting chemotaxis protein [Pseudomonas syringae pv. tomato]
MKNLGFSKKILLAAALIVVVAFSVFIVINDYRQRQSLKSSVKSELQQLGTLTTQNIQTWLESRIQLLQSMSQQVAVDGKELPQLQRAIGLPTYSDNFQLSYFGSTEGVMFSVPAGNRPADYDPRARGWYKAAQNAPGTIVTEPYIAASSGKLVMTIATPVKIQNQLAGVAGADISLDSVSKIINSLNFDGHGYAFLVSAEGKILVHPDSKLVLKNINEAYPVNTPKIATGVTEIDSGKTARDHLVHAGSGRSDCQLVRGAGAGAGFCLRHAHRVPHLGHHGNGRCGDGDHFAAGPVDPCADAAAAPDGPCDARYC